MQTALEGAVYEHSVRAAAHAPCDVEGDGDGERDMAASASDAVRATTARRRDRAAWDVGRRRLCVYFFFKSSMAVLYAGVVGGCTGSRRALVSSRA